MLKRNIVTNLTFTNNLIKLVVLEKLSTTIVEIFSSESTLENYPIFLKESLNKIKQLLGAKVTKVSITLEPTKQLEEKIQIVRETIKIPSQFIQHQDIQNLITLAKTKYKQNARQVILVQPISFEVHDVITKLYNKAPIHKKGHALTMSLAITTINEEVYNSITNLLKSYNLNISQILLTPQALSFNNVSEHAQNSGAALLSVDYNHSYLTIVRNYAVISYIKLENVGYNFLLQKIMKEFECNIFEAKKLIVVYSDLSHDVTNRIINLNNYVVEKNLLKNNLKLNEIVKEYISNILFVTYSYLKQKLTYKYETFPIIISGQITKVQRLEEYSRIFLKNNLVYTFSPLTYVEQNDNNLYSLGMIKFMNKSDEIAGLFYDTIIETNLDTLTSYNIKTLKSRKLWEKIWHRIGEKYG